MMYPFNHIFSQFNRFILMTLLVFLFSNCWYHPSEIFDYSSNSHIKAFHSDRSVPFNEILKAADQFYPSGNGKNFRLRSGRNPLWLQMKLKYFDQNISEDNRKYFEIQSTHLNLVEYYFPARNSAGNVEYAVRKTGTDFSLKQRDVPFRNLMVSVPANTLQDEFIYVRMESDLALTVNLLYLSNDRFYRRLTIDHYYFGIIYGLLLAMLFYNLFVAVALKSKTYLYYILYIISILVFVSNLYGHLWFLIDSSLEHHLKILWVAGGFVMISSCQFVRNFLSTESRSKNLNRALYFINALGALLVVSGIFEFYSAANILARTFSFLAPLLYVGAGILSYKKGFKSAGLLLFSWMVLFIAFIGLATKGISIPFVNLFSFISLPAAFAIESILLSIALANMLRKLEKEKEEAVMRGNRFEEMSITDSLTGFFNRRYFESKLQSEMLHARLMRRPLGLIVIDFDNFKMINDTYGHAQGDTVLRELAKILLENKRSEDILCRYGGEEFACLLPGTDLQGSIKIAEKMRKKCESKSFSPGPFEQFNVTVSAGVTTFYSEDDNDSILDRADQLMYRAKKTGKNTVIAE